MKLKNQILTAVLVATFLLSFLQFAFFVSNQQQIPIAQAAQSTNLDTNMTSYIGSSGEEAGEATGIGLDNTVWYGGAIANLSVNYNKTPINILGGGVGTILHFDSDGKTLKNIIRLPSAVKDIAMDKTQNRLAAIGDFGLVYIDTTNYNLIWNKILPVDSAAHPDNFKFGSRVDIGTNGNIASLYGKRVTVWNQSGTNLTGSGNTTFGMQAKFVTDIALVDANNTVVVIGETQKDGGPCSQWRSGWMKGYSHTGTQIWKNYDWTQYEVAGTVAPNLTNYCADSSPKRVTLGADNNLYMIAESAGGNSQYQADPRDLTKTTTSIGKNAGGDNFNNTFNMNSQNITFMMKYAPLTGNLIMQQVWVARLAAGTNPSGGGANTMFARDIAVNEDGIIGFVGRSAAWFADRNIQVQTLNGSTIPAYDGNGDGFYLELLPDMRTRARATVFKKTLEQEIKSVAMKGNKRVVAGEIKTAGAQVPTMNPIQSSNAGGITEGIIATWGFENLTKDYKISATKSPTNPTQALGSSFTTTYNYSYAGTVAPQDITLKMTLFEGLIYANDLFDGFSCSGINPKICTKTITASQWQSGSNQTLNMSIPNNPAVFNGKTNKEILFQLYPSTSSTADVDVYPTNNIDTVPITLDLTVPTAQDYTMTPTLMSVNPIPLGGYAEIKVDYAYSGPVGVADKRIVFVVPAGLEYDPLNRTSISPSPCPIVSGLETCSKSTAFNTQTNTFSQTIYFRVKNPASGNATKNIIFNLVDSNGNTLNDNNNANHTNKTVYITTTTTLATSDYGISFGALSDNTIPVSGSKSVPLNFQYTGTTSPTTQKLTINIPTGLSYEYLTNNGFVCVAGTNAQICTRNVIPSQWLNNTFSLPINIKADPTFTNPPARTITASLSAVSGNSAIDTTPTNNTAQVVLNLTNTQPTSSANSSAQVSSTQVSSANQVSSTNVSSGISSNQTSSLTQSSTQSSIQISSQVTISSVGNNGSNIVITPSWTATQQPVSPKLIGTNMYDTSIANLSNPTYLARMLDLKPAFVRIHNSDMMKDSAISPLGFTTKGANNNVIWDRVRLKAFADSIKGFRSAGYNPELMFNIPPTLPTDYDPFVNTTKFANQMADIVRILNVENGLGIKYFEITNEIDDGFQGGTDCGSSVNYCSKPFSELVRLYNSAATAMKSVDSSIKTGGLSYQNPYANVDAFIDGAITNNTLDFVSYHAYSTYGNPVDQLSKTFNDPKSLMNIGNDFRTKLNIKSPNKRIEIFHDEYNICYVYACGFGENTPNTSNQRMAGQEGAVFDALGYLYGAQYGLDSVMTWNEKDQYYGKLDSQYNKRAGALLLEIFKDLKIVSVSPHTTTNSPTNEGNLKSLAFKTSDGKDGVLMINRTNTNGVATIATTANRNYTLWSLDNSTKTITTPIVNSSPADIAITGYSVNAVVFDTINATSSANSSAQISSVQNSSVVSSTQVSSLTQSSVNSSQVSSQNISSATNYQVVINNITIVGNNYQVNFTPSGYTPSFGGIHTHFYYDTEANTVMNKMVSQPSPYILAQSAKPAMATKLCSIVSNPDHSIIPNSGNCVDLPTNQTSSQNVSSSINQNSSANCVIVVPLVPNCSNNSSQNQASSAVSSVQNSSLVSSTNSSNQSSINICPVMSPRCDCPEGQEKYVPLGSGGLAGIIYCRNKNSSSANSSMVSSQTSSTQNSSQVSSTANSSQNSSKISSLISSAPVSSITNSSSSFITSKELDFGNNIKPLVELQNTNNCRGFDSINMLLIDNVKYSEFRASCGSTTIKTYWFGFNPNLNYKMVKYNPNTKIKSDFGAIFGKEYKNNQFVITTQHTINDNNTGDYESTNGKIWDPFTIITIDQNTVLPTNNLVLPNTPTTQNTINQNIAIAPVIAQTNQPNLNITNNNSNQNGASDSNQNNNTNSNNSNQNKDQVLGQSNNSNSNQVQNKTVRTGGNEISQVLGVIGLILSAIFWIRTKDDPII